MSVLMRIPLAVPDAGFFPYLTVEDHQFGDPYCVTIRVPKECNGVLHLPRGLLREMALARKNPVTTLDVLRETASVGECS